MPPKRDRSGEYARRKAKCITLNICFRCSRSKGQNEWLCDGCLDKTNAKDKHRRQTRATYGLCSCGRQMMLGLKACTKCLEMARLIQEKRRSKHRLAGTCLTCGRPPVYGQSTCAACRHRATISTMARYHSNIILQICAFCGNSLNQSTFRCDNCHEQHILRGKTYWSEKHVRVLDHYGNRCQCCSISQLEFLDIDHINGGGTKHRSSVNCHFYDWVIRNNFPTDLQLLCANCNRGKSKFNLYPHSQNPLSSASKRAKQNRHRRLKIIANYGGACKCCGESNWAFLEFDHLNNDGAKHRKIIGNKISQWIIANNYPDTIQLLCSNCNKAKSNGKICPHQQSECVELPKEVL